MTIKEELINTPYRDSCVIPSITPQEIPQNPQIPNIPVKINRMGWICPNCGNSISPDIFSCPKCSNSNSDTTAICEIYKNSFKD